MIGLGDLPLPDDLTLMVMAAGLLVLRLSLMVFLLPALGDPAISVRIRLMVVLTTTAAMAPALIPANIAALEQQDLLALAAYEGVIGFALGFGFRVLIFVLMTAGTIAAHAMSLSQIFGAGVVEEPNPSVSMLLMAAGGALFVTLDLHTQAMGLFFESYMLFPLGEVPDTGALAQWATKRTTDAFALGVSLAMPFILINFVYNIVLGLINQAMPQMMVTFIGVPANVMAGLFLLLVAVVVMLNVWLDAVRDAFGGFW